MGTKLEVVESLMELGLTEYEARCFAALTQLSEATAKEISRVADVPQSRVYDVADRLHELGVVDVQESKPQRYYAVPVDRALERLRREYSDALETAATRLGGLETRDADPDGAWEVVGPGDVRDRYSMHVADAEVEVYLVIADEALLEREVFEPLAEAADRGVSVYAEVPSESACERVHEAVPAAKVAVDEPAPAVDGAARQPGRLVLVDRETVLLSAVQEGLVPGETTETGLWGTGVGHGLVVWFRAVVERRRQRRSFRTP